MKKDREIVGYISTYGKQDGVSVQIQKEMIQRYCKFNHLVCSQIFMDVGQRANRDIEGRKRAKILGLSAKKWSIMYEQWEKMLLGIKAGEYRRKCRGRKQEILFFHEIHHYRKYPCCQGMVVAAWQI